MILTGRNRDVLVFIAGYTAQTGCFPTFREIGLATGLRSTNTVAWHVGRLRNAGLLHAEPMLPRTIRLADDVGITPDGFIARAVPVGECWRCRAQHPSDLSRCPNVGAAPDLTARSR